MKTSVVLTDLNKKPLFEKNEEHVKHVEDFDKCKECMEHSDII